MSKAPTAWPDGDPVKVMGLRVIQADTLPEGILLFERNGVTVGIIDNRAKN